MLPEVNTGKREEAAMHWTVSPTTHAHAKAPAARPQNVTLVKKKKALKRQLKLGRV